jgi:uncharacterized protein
MFKCSADSETPGHTIFAQHDLGDRLLKNRSVRTPVALARSLRLTIVFAFLLSVIPVSVFAYTSPGKPRGFVSDFAHILSASDIQSLDVKLQSLEGATGDQVAVVTIQSLGDETIETYATKLFQEWGIGSKAHDNGLLILVSPTDREARIEVGYGLEGTVTDLQSGNIIRKVMIPAFQDGDYPAGILGATDAVISITTGSADAAQYSDSIPDRGSSSSAGYNWAGIFFFVIIMINAMARILGRTKSWWLGGVLGAVAGAIVGLIWGFVPIGAIAILVLTIVGLVFDFIVSRHPPGPGGRGGMGGLWPLLFMGRNGGGSVNGGFGGGFGGFGGGMSGGGGASGKW